MIYLELLFTQVCLFTSKLLVSAFPGRDGVRPGYCAIRLPANVRIFDTAVEKKKSAAFTGREEGEVSMRAAAVADRRMLNRCQANKNWRVVNNKQW